MKQKSCFLCDEPITKANDSREHIICNAVGGVRKTRGFICRPCNSGTGSGWDAELAKQLNILSLFFCIARDRGTPPAQQVQTVTGQKLLMQTDGQLSMVSPTFQKTKTDSGVQIQVIARDMREARQSLEGLKRKHSEIDVEQVLKTGQPSLVAPDGPVTFSLQFGGEGAGRSVVKTAAAFAHHCGLDSRTFNAAKAYLGNPKGEPCFGYYHERDLVSERPVGLPIHCVAVSANPDTGLLLGYVEYFGFQRMVVCLSNIYQGPSVNRVYAIDPLKGQELALNVDLHFTTADVQDIYGYGRLPTEAMRDALEAILPTALKRQADAEQTRALKKAINYGFANCGAKMGDILTEEHVQKMSWLIAERMTPFIQRRMDRRRPALPSQKN